MPKESGPQSGGMNRREFLKTVVASTGVASLGKEAQAQAPEKKVLDNTLGELVALRQNDKINYPDKFKIITPEMEDVLYSIQKYNEAIAAGNTPNSSLQNNASQAVSSIANEDLVTESRRALFDQLKKVDVELGGYSDELFFKTLAYETPKLLAEYGIYMRPLYMSVLQHDNAGNPVSFLQNHILIYLSQITRIRRDDVEQDGVSVHRDILHAQDFKLHDREIGFQNTGLVAQTYFSNIIIFDNRIDIQVASLTELLENIKKDVERYPPGESIKARQAELEKNNEWSTAAEIVMVKLAGKIKKKIDRQQLEEETLAHETRHLVDQKNIDFKKFFPFIKTTSPNESMVKGYNHGAHDEINPILAQLIHSSNKELTLLNFIGQTRDVAIKESGIYGFSYRWIIKQMIGLVSIDPEHYDIEIDNNSRISKTNQILSQMDVLVGNPELFNTLCYKILEFHNQNLTENIVGGSDPLEISSLTDQIRSIARPIAKIGIPTAIAAGALEVLRRRKKKVAQENMSRMERRAKEKAEKKQAKKR